MVNKWRKGQKLSNFCDKRLNRYITLIRASFKSVEPADRAKIIKETHTPAFSNLYLGRVFKLLDIE